ncbi:MULTISPECIES: single-stranded DNA-binding protein [unclassified Paenibacillus]|uniref:single-stranded DNA-binding protein n=1 Tax=unclassified Paenibacillus TaxID=185978 RepID=UPI002787DFE2|nr:MULTISPECIES: single-stranded DNA-binding protein [unclassified Paenibacillus]MDQ0896356.1 single stranded DNA-binding protein [Paenibacillus sp. V4I7]MDQ0914101.1 single stranded DNA-binding protein [Paenibacillus sp. V4I5]
MFKRNAVELVGNLVDNPDFKDMGDFKVANFILAVDRTVDLNDGNTADFIPIVCKNDLAVSADTYLRKGRRIFVDGRIQVRTYNDDQGNRRWVTEIVAKNIQYLDAPPEGVANGSAQGSRNNYNQGGNQSNSNGSGQRNSSNRGNYSNGGGNRSTQGQGSGNRTYGNRGGQSSGTGGNGNGNRGGSSSGGNNNARYGNNNSGNYGNQGGTRSYSGAGAGGGGRGNSNGNGSMPWEQ